TDMRAAVERLERAIAQNEKILIYGDYDVDGTMAVVVLRTALKSLGAQVDEHIPHRLEEGYGMRASVVERAAADGYRVILSVDTGIREHAVLARARELGLDCILTDHHLPGDGLPIACAILNPRRADCAYPEKALAGVGVALKLAQAVMGSRLTSRQLESYLKVACLGTIADVVPLVGENRVIARFGLQGLGEPSQAGLSALLEVSDLAGKPVTTGDVAFRLAPRINAAGRMQDARQVIELLTTTDRARAIEIAEDLNELNYGRQKAEEGILREILSEVEKKPGRVNCYSLVFAGEGWHRGVIGIVAQRVVERFHRPTLVLGIEDGQAVGSGRSIRSFHLLDALTSTADLFDRFGGHAQAAGFSLPAGKVPELEKRLEEYARKNLSPADLEPVLHIDAEVLLDELGWNTYDDLRRLEPCGSGNPTPVFAARNVGLEAPPRIMKEKHLKIRVRQGAVPFDALGWQMAALAPKLKAGERVDIAFSLEANSFRGETTLQLILKDVQPSEK
ncbi:MAG: single-stranded-DNA-specific exonuclease RecJ, partial [Acidobacteria bacterium]|nr:single-stranded-DNA-specific exonuclease RecJ [Acidobacteriota bacterium]